MIQILTTKNYFILLDGKVSATSSVHTKRIPTDFQNSN